MATRLHDAIAEQRKLEATMQPTEPDPNESDPALHPHRAYTATPTAGMTNDE